MKSLRLLVLITLALGLTQVHAQQEVDPDHFDHPASQVTTHRAEPGWHSTVVQHRQKQNHVNLARKIAGGKSHHHHAHTSA